MKASSFLFSLLLFLLGITTNAIAVPQPITLPFARIQGRTDVDPSLRHRRNVNRGLRRLAQLTGRSEPASIEGRGSPSESIHPRAVGQDNNPIGGPETDNPGRITRGKETTTAHSLPLHVLGSDDKYLFTTYIGTPPRPFLMVADTGSTNMWVPSDETCQTQASPSCGIHQYLGSKTSATFGDDPGTTWTKANNWGKVAGHTAWDNVTVAGIQLGQVGLGVGTTLYNGFNSDMAAFDGAVGFGRTLGIPQAPGLNNPSLLETLASTIMIPAAIVSFKFPRVSDVLNDGEVKFGGLNPSKYIEGTDVVLINTDNKGLWSAPIDSVTINQQDTGIRGRTAIFDTSSPGLYMSSIDSDVIHKKIPNSKFDTASGQYSIPCQTDVVLELKFGAQSFAINSRDLVGQSIDGTNCYSHILGDGDSQLWIAGVAFLKNVYFSLNSDKNTITLAKLS